MIQLYDYQQALVDNVRREIANGHKSVLVQSPTGSGKTVIFSYIAKNAITKGGKVLILTDRIELLTETGGTLDQFGIKSYQITAGQMAPPPNYYSCFVAMAQTLTRRITPKHHPKEWDAWFKQFAVVIIDECFVAGTRVGSKRIEDIKIGDVVDSFNHKTGVIEQKKVLSTFKNKIKDDLIKIKFPCAQLVCTKKHPIFVLDKGYINAEKIKKNDRVILHDLWESNEKRGILLQQLEPKKEKVFKKRIHFLFCKMSQHLLCANALKENDPEKPNGIRRNKRENEGNFKKDWPQTGYPGREWAWDDFTPKNIIGGAFAKNTLKLVSRISSNITAKVFRWAKVSLSLQNRHRLSRSENCNRNRRGVPSVCNLKKEGLKENEAFRIERVQSVEVCKQGGQYGFRECDKNNYVYNIEVEDNNNYFANGVLVHNCHKQTFNPFFTERPDLFNGAQILGFTATPSRMGKMRQLGADYSKMVEGLQVMELISRGRLLPDKYYTVVAPQKSTYKLNSRGDDFDESEMFKSFDRPEFYEGAIEAYRTHAAGTSNLVFCCNIQHVIRTCEEFNAAGIPAKFLTSAVAKPKRPEIESQAKMARYERDLERHNKYVEAYAKYSGERKQLIKEWKSGAFQVMINAGILTTGFNFPALQTIQVLRATISVPLWLQIIGRGSRTHPGKEYFNILDHGRNGERLGRYRDNRRWSLIHKETKGGGAAPVKECGESKRNDTKAVNGKYPDKKGRFGCGAYINASVTICPYCGYIYQTEKERVKAELELLSYEIIAQPGAPIKQEFNFEEIERTALSRGYKDGWVVRQIALAHGREGLATYAKAKGHSNGWVWHTAKRLGI